MYKIHGFVINDHLEHEFSHGTYLEPKSSIGAVDCFNITSVALYGLQGTARHSDLYTDVVLDIVHVASRDDIYLTYVDNEHVDYLDFDDRIDDDHDSNNDNYSHNNDDIRENSNESFLETNQLLTESSPGGSRNPLNPAQEAPGDHNAA